MADSVVLVNADMGLFADFEATRVVIPHLVTQDRQRTYDLTTVPFEGDEQETGFRGVGRPRTYDLKARFPYNEHDDYRDLIDLFEAAHDAPDGRLVLRTNARLVEGLDLFEVVLVSDVGEQHIGGQAWDVKFAARTVNYTLEV